MCFETPVHPFSCPVSLESPSSPETVLRKEPLQYNLDSELPTLLPNRQLQTTKLTFPITPVYVSSSFRTNTNPSLSRYQDSHMFLVRFLSNECLSETTYGNSRSSGPGERVQNTVLRGFSKSMVNLRSW